jgi:hypothetical protein
MKTLLFIIIGLLISQVLYSQEIKFSPEKVDFGQLYENSNLKSIEVTLNNLSNNVQIITEYKFSKNPANILSTSMKTPFEIAKVSQKSFLVTITPSSSFIGVLESNLMLKIQNTDTTIFIPIRAEILPVLKKPFINVKIPKDSSEINSNYTLPIILNSLERNGNDIDNFEITISYNSTLLVPTSERLSDVFEFGNRYTTFKNTVPSSIKSGDTILKVDFITAVGNATGTEIKIVSIKIKNQSTIIPSESSFEHGYLNLTGLIFENNIPRLISEKNNDYVIFDFSNPINNDFNLKISYISEAALEIYTINGNKVADLSSLLPYTSIRKEFILPISRNIFPGPGLYIIKLSGKTAISSKLIIAQ